MRSIRGFYFITGGALSKRGDRSDVREAVRAGAGVVQYRDKVSASAFMYERARNLKRLCKGVFFIVNDRVDIALAVNADGVHLGQNDMPLAAARRILGKKKIIGVSVRTIREASKAVKAGADYLGVGPVFATTTKADADRPVGTDIIRKIKARFDIPVVAIGGITVRNARCVIESGADAVCAISDIVSGNAVGRRIKMFQAMFKGAV